MALDPRASEISATPIGWYVHLPFCRSKCGYCDFYSLPTIPELLDGFVRSITLEMAIRDPGRRVETAFIGGGTPTELPADALGAVLAAVAERVGRPAEWTVEANPASGKATVFEMLRRRGVDRLSIGAQSFDARELRFLERIHGPDDIGESVRAARFAGFGNLSLDLIYAIPGQSLDSWRSTLGRVLDLGVEHLSCYALTYEDDTPLARLRQQGRIAPCDESLEIDMFELTIEQLSAAGFEHYEISNFARPGRRCLANLVYWQNREYVGFGPSAVSYLDGVRTKNVPDVHRYVELMSAGADAIIIERERLGPRRRACETAVQMLRLTDGIDAGVFRSMSGFDAHVLFAEPIRRFSGTGLLSSTDEAIRLTPRGMLLANRVMAEFLLDESPQP
jgi:oxygen-independent coproporphyrinogen-3 oxidase